MCKDMPQWKSNSSLKAPQNEPGFVEEKTSDMIALFWWIFFPLCVPTPIQHKDSSLNRICRFSSPVKQICELRIGVHAFT